jgi:serine/threonine-protein kinase
MWIAMELIDGCSLAEWAAAPRTLGERLDVAIAICEALQAAHEHSFVDDFGLSRKGVYHGDLKPSNVLIRRDNSPVLLDFMLPDLQRTIAADNDGADRTELPITGMMGTPGFMAPEQEQYGLVSPQSDIYSLGMTFCTLFAPNDPVPAWFTVTEEPPTKRMFPLSLLTRWSAPDDLNVVPRNVQSLPSVLLRTIRQMLQPDHASRPSDVGVVLRALRGIRDAD